MARQVAWKSTHRIKIGAVLVHKGQVLNVGHNKVGKSHPKYPWSLHAELDACLGIHRADLRGASLYLFRTNSLGLHGICKPCDVCQSVLKELGIKEVCYTVNGWGYRNDSNWAISHPNVEEMKL